MNKTVAYNVNIMGWYWVYTVIFHYVYDVTMDYTVRRVDLTRTHLLNLG